MNELISVLAPNTRFGKGIEPERKPMTTTTTHNAHHTTPARVLFVEDTMVHLSYAWAP